MSLKHKKERKFSTVEEGSEDDSSEWIMSYADTVTLLLCFFIIFFAEQKKVSEQEILMQLTKDLKQNQKKAEEGETTSAQMISKIEEEVKAELAKEANKKIKVGIEKRRKEILIRLFEKDFFHIGKYKLKSAGADVLAGVSQLLSPYQEKILIRVEGHSDSLAVNPLAGYKNNLNLSSLRASEASQVLIKNGFPEGKLRVVGYGSAKPLVDDRAPASEGGEYIPERGLLNRRIEIRIMVAEAQADRLIEQNIK